MLGSNKPRGSVDAGGLFLDDRGEELVFRQRDLQAAVADLGGLADDGVGDDLLRREARNGREVHRLAVDLAALRAGRGHFLREVGDGVDVRQIGRALVGDLDRVGGGLADLQRIGIVDDLEQDGREALPERAGLGGLLQTLGGADGRGVAPFAGLDAGEDDVVRLRLARLQASGVPGDVVARDGAARRADDLGLGRSGVGHDHAGEVGVTDVEARPMAYR